MKRKLTVGHVIIVAILCMMALMSLYPVWYTAICSFSSKEFINSGQIFLWPKGFHLEAYKKILEDGMFLSTTWVSVKRVIVACTVQIVTLVMTSFPLYLPKKFFPGGKIVLWFLVAHMFFSGGMIPSYMIMREYGLMNSFWALILPSAFPLGNLVIMINFLRTIPFELFEAASIDGANPLQILWKVYVPLSKPSIATMLLFSFVGQWNAYFDGLIYINDLNKQPLQTYIFQLEVDVDYSKMTAEQIMEAMKQSNASFNSAKVFAAMVPILCIYPFVQKYFTKGLVIGAVKG